MRYLLLFLAFTFLACTDDPTTDSDDGVGTAIPDPNFSLQQPTQITVTDAAGVLLRSYDLTYTGQQLTQVVTTGTQIDDQTITLDYLQNNQLSTLEVTDPAGTLVQECELLYTTQFVQIDCEVNAGMNTRTIIDVDQNNRINFVEYNLRDMNAFIQDGTVEYRYGQNEDANRIIIQNLDVAQNGDFALDYDVRNNPFLNVNELVSQLLFRELYPTGLHNPITALNNAGTQDLILEYIYDDQDFPIQVSVFNRMGNTQQLDYTVDYNYMTQ